MRFLFLLTFLAGPVLALEPGTVKVSGRVVLVHGTMTTDPKPVPGARVRLEGESGVSPVIADATGRYTIEVPRRAKVYLVVEGEKLVPSVQPTRSFEGDAASVDLFAVPAELDQFSDGLQRILTGIIGSPEVGLARDPKEGKILGLVADEKGQPCVGATIRVESASPRMAALRKAGHLYVAPAGNIPPHPGFIIVLNVPPGPVTLVTSDFPESRWAHARYLIDPVEAKAVPGAVTFVMMKGRPNPWTPPPEARAAPVRFEPSDWSLGYVNQSANTDADASLALGSGVAVGDLDGNGWLDLVCTGGMGSASGVMMQQSAGKFVAGGSGIDWPVPEKVALVLGDLDNDGDLDAYQGSLGPDQLFENQGGAKFQEISAKSFVSDDGNARTVAMADLDADGRLDLFSGNYDLGSRINMDSLENPGQGNTLHQNLGKLRFREVAGAAGVRQSGLAFAQAFVDLDGDGLDDLVLAHDHGPLKLYMNRSTRGTAEKPGTIRFEDVSQKAGFTVTGSWMGIAVGDVDRDGDLDLFVPNTGLAEPMYDPIAPEGSFTHALYRNDGVVDGVPHFTDVAAASGVSDAGWGWGCRFEDMDNDGWLDLVMVTNMYIGAIGASGVYPSVIGVMPPGGIGGTPGHVFFNDGTGKFWEGTKGAGIDIPHDARAVTTPDLDRDGYPDMVVGTERGPFLTYRNTGKGNHFVEIALRGDGITVNRSAIGAIVTLESEAGKQVRVHQSGDGFKTGSSPVLHFGLGSHAGPVTVTVNWPGGHRQKFEGLKADELHELVHIP